MIVVDAGILLCSYFPSDHEAIVDRLFRDDSEWLAPPVWRNEFRNVTGKFLRQGLSYEKAIEIVELAERFMESHEVPVSSDEVMALIGESGCSAYDCEYIAVALKKAAPLITLNRHMTGKFPGIAFQAHEYLGNRQYP